MVLHHLIIRHLLLQGLVGGACDCHLVLERVVDLHFTVDTKRDRALLAAEHWSNDQLVIAKAARGVVHAARVQEF